MESEDEAQDRINRHHEEVARKKREALYAQYMARVALYAAARAQRKWPVDFQPCNGQMAADALVGRR